MLFRSVAAAYMMSEDCRVSGEIFAVGGGRIARMTIAESAGILGVGSSIEEVRDAMPDVMTDSGFFYPKDLSERSAKVADRFGVRAGLDTNNAYAVSPTEKR